MSGSKTQPTHIGKTLAVMYKRQTTDYKYEKILCFDDKKFNQTDYFDFDTV